MALDILAPLDWAQKFGLIDKIKPKLVNNPDAAAEKLATVFLELSKIFQAIDQELVEYMALSFADDDSLKEERKTLLRFEGGQIADRIDGSRGHCHKIWNIYQKYLNAWFQRVLNTEEQQEMERIFSSLVYADSAMGMVMYDISSMLNLKATLALDAIDKQDIAEASKIVRNARAEFKPLREELRKNIRELNDLYTLFIDVTGTT